MELWYLFWHCILPGLRSVNIFFFEWLHLKCLCNVKILQFGFMEHLLNLKRWITYVSFVLWPTSNKQKLNWIKQTGQIFREKAIRITIALTIYIVVCMAFSHVTKRRNSDAKEHLESSSGRINIKLTGFFAFSLEFVNFFSIPGVDPKNLLLLVR